MISNSTKILLAPLPEDERKDDALPAGVGLSAPARIPMYSFREFIFDGFLGELNTRPRAMSSPSDRHEAALFAVIPSYKIVNNTLHLRARAHVPDRTSVIEDRDSVALRIARITRAADLLKRSSTACSISF